MNYENSMESLKSEIERIKTSLIRSEMNFDKKSKKLQIQLIALQKAVEILKNN